MGAPFVYGMDGPDAFSCSGLMRYILRTTGVDANTPWIPEEYLSRYAPVAPENLQPGDIVIYPGWATITRATVCYSTPTRSRGLSRRPRWSMPVTR